MGKDKSCFTGVCGKAANDGVAEGQDQALCFALNAFFLNGEGN